MSQWNGKATGEMRNVPARSLKPQKTANTPDQWEKADKLITGSDPLIAGIRKKLDLMSSQLDAAAATFKDTQRVLAKHKQMGVGRTEAPALLLRPLRDLNELAEHAEGLSKNLKRTLEQVLRDVGEDPSRL